LYCITEVRANHGNFGRVGLTETGNDLFGQPVSDVFLIGIAGEIFKWQHSHHHVGRSGSHLGTRLSPPKDAKQENYENTGRQDRQHYPTARPRRWTLYGRV
jgi:hypothetical protein